MGKEDIIDYVMKTPENTNPNVLRSLLDSDGGLPTVSSSDNGRVLKVNIGEPGDVSWKGNVPTTIALPFTYDGTGNTIFYHGSELPDDDVLQAIYNDGGFSLKLIAQGTYDDIVICFARLVSAPSGVSDTWYFATGMLGFGGMGTACALVEIDNTSKYVTGRFFFPAKQMNRFIVTLTPTALDYSGTMDKTVAQINEAYEAGQEIVFRVMTSATEHMDVDCTARWHADTTYPSFNGFILSGDNDGTLIFAFTSATDDGTKQTYGTTIYSLTPAS